MGHPRTSRGKLAQFPGSTETLAFSPGRQFRLGHQPREQVTAPSLASLLFGANLPAGACPEILPLGGKV